MKRPGGAEPGAAEPGRAATRIGEARGETGARGQGAERAGVRGERGIPIIARALSVQAKATHFLALGLMLAIGIAALLWYYSQQLGRPGRARQNARAGTSRLAATEMALPPLGPIEVPWFGRASAGVPGASPPRESPVPPAPPAPPGRFALGGDSATLPAAASPALMALPAARTSAGSATTAPYPYAYPAAAAPTPSQRSLQRRLSASVLITAPPATTASAQQALSAPAAPEAGVAPPLPLPGAAGAADAAAVTADKNTAAGGARGELSALLQPAANPAASAYRLPDLSLLLPRGAFIDCTLETAIDSTLPGMTTCVTATDTFSADGRVVLLERGTKLVGETRGQVEQGAARVFVLWTEARTPDGVLVPLDSPGADQLGRAGLPGKVQRHFWERFGAAILVSSIDGAVQAAVQSSNRGNGTVIYDPGAVQDVMTGVLKSTVAIAPTVIKRNGDRIQVLVARDVDFSRVYQLRDVDRDR